MSVSPVTVVGVVFRRSFFSGGVGLVEVDWWNQSGAGGVLTISPGLNVTSFLPEAFLEGEGEGG